MQQRDIIKDEIERLGRGLGKLVAMMFNTEGGDMNPAQAWEIAQDQFRDEFDFEIDDVLELPPADLMIKLDELHLHPQHYDQLGDVLTAWAGREEDPSTRQRLLRRALLLYDLAGEKSGTFCMVRAKKETDVKAQLK
ncbi:hypothetical protein FUA23_04690 [Neolewinella aurantiaca]|uniref:Uncharacterized protein n=1 Tax=Neolewinella aurantiaca TaxID=2602767 RepID=A0A5C7FL66_9BACT|nr:hypothetical protein [Neolewinella aurantiaca]TXF90741.1 hypothetical protein FUA23_04690 [Neolewinella aurantiaca]